MSKEHNMKTGFIVAGFGMLLGACSTPAPGPAPVTQPPIQASAPAPDADPETQCLPSTAAVTSHSPLMLYLSAGHCLDQNRLDEAIFLFATAGSQGRFDTYRVPDTTAHQLASFMSIMFMKHVGEETYARFSAHMRLQLMDNQARNAFCQRLGQLPPPSYHPQYMINHGMAAFTSSGGQQALNPLSDPRQTWNESVQQYMDCKP